MASLRRKNKNSQPEPERGLLAVVRDDLAEQGISRPDERDLSRSLHLIGKASVENVRTLQREFSGLGPLAGPLQDTQVTDVVLNGDGSVWADRGEGMQPIDGMQIGAEAARDLAVRMATLCGERLDEARPFADGVLRQLPPDVPAQAIRVHTLLAPPAAGGSCISLRAIKGQQNSLDALVQGGLASQEMAGVLRWIVRARRNILISGGTGAGKTTLLAALLAEVAYDQRLLVVEDTPELLIDHPHVVALATREGNAEGAGAISMTALVKQSLRMRPDRIVVGEIRGPEVADLLVALNTGHAGSAGTIHANDPASVPGRLEALGAMAGLDRIALTRQVIDGIDVVLHVSRTEQGRRLTHIGRLVGDERARIEVLWHWRDGVREGFEEFRDELGCGRGAL
ncbi:MULTISPECIES: TadA family conjugal transfer-associated ATPase [unclassified Corynebacterium]|uniref:TadA family conjugal transfer-associated ATPase n=1 Tax=unclassified Corynebacterium TaxID=2624378 RepID=UPI001EF4292D|nr:TadA family conjugal transfer-associated ATPase [Corynebacterium sp. ACRQK]MCG7262853.1 TadA family conjugal transfer-associated ATPase [Corynebacterium sp. ACRQL]